MTTLAIPEGLEPLAAWDARDGYTVEKMQQTAWWIKDHLGRQLAAHVYRVEFYLLDGPFAVVSCYKLNADGFRHNGPDGKIATEPPVIVPLAELPPAHLLRG